MRTSNPSSTTCAGANCRRGRRPGALAWSLLAASLLAWLLAAGCDPIHNPRVGPLRLPLAAPPTHVIRVAGVESVFPVLYGLRLRRAAGLPSTAVAIFATAELPPPAVLGGAQADLRRLVEESAWDLDEHGDVPGLGRLACDGIWGEGQRQLECSVPGIPVLNEGWLLYALAEPQLPWIEITLGFQRVGLPDPPAVRVEEARDEEVAEPGAAS